MEGAGLHQGSPPKCTLLGPGELDVPVGKIASVEGREIICSELVQHQHKQVSSASCIGVRRGQTCVRAHRLLLQVSNKTVRSARADNVHHTEGHCIETLCQNN